MTRLLLDEMLRHTIAVQLGRLKYDVMHDVMSVAADCARRSYRPWTSC